MPRRPPQLPLSGMAWSFISWIPFLVQFSLSTGLVPGRGQARSLRRLRAASPPGELGLKTGRKSPRRGSRLCRRGWAVQRTLLQCPRLPPP